MSTSYYLVDKKKKAEFKAFEKIWETKFYPKFVEQLYKYAEKINGDLVNEDFIEDIVDNDLFRIKYFPESSDRYEDRIGCAGINGFRFDNWLGIHDLKSLKKYLAEHPNHVVENECEENITDKLDEIVVNVH